MTSPEDASPPAFTEADWPTREEAAALLNVSTRTIDRYIREGQIEAAHKRQPGRKFRTVCNPRDLERLKPQTHVMPALELQRQQQTAAIARPPMAGTPPLQPQDVAQLLHLMASLAAPAPPQASYTRFLTLEQAANYTGLTRAFLERAIEEEQLPAVRDRAWKVRREDLDKL